jgi:hypothetical protein
VSFPLWGWSTPEELQWTLEPARAFGRSDEAILFKIARWPSHPACTFFVGPPRSAAGLHAASSSSKPAAIPKQNLNTKSLRSIGGFSMELRQLTTENEREIFATCLIKARSTRGAGFRDRSRSRLTESHLTFGDLYGLFENDGEGQPQMVGGFAMHDLATLPQSHPSPDMSHLPAHQVFEGTELWSLSRGIAPIAASAAAAVAGIMQAKAILVYPICKPFDLSAPYARFNFRGCEPVKFPYGQTNDGEEIWVRPMVLEGDSLEEYVRFGFDFLFRSDPEHHGLQFGIRSLPRPATNVPRSEEVAVESQLMPHSHHGDERNGSAAI